jgi:hypothetical protein
LQNSGGSSVGSSRLKEAEMLSPPWIALNRDATVGPLLSHQNPHQSREAGSFFGQMQSVGTAPLPVVQTSAIAADSNDAVRSYRTEGVHLF